MNELELKYHAYHFIFKDLFYFVSVCGMCICECTCLQCPEESKESLGAGVSGA